MITRRGFWKKTVGVAAAAIAAITGRSAVKADFVDGTTPIKWPEGKGIRFKLASVVPVNNNLFPLSTSGRSMWIRASSIRCGKNTGPLMGVAVLYRAMLDQALMHGQTFEEYISDCEKKDFEESMRLRTRHIDNFEDCRLFPPPDFGPNSATYQVSNERKTIREILSKGQFAELELAAKDCIDYEIFTHKNIYDIGTTCKSISLLKDHSRFLLLSSATCLTSSLKRIFF